LLDLLKATKIMYLFSKLYSKLNLTTENGLFHLSDDTWKERCSFSKRIENILENKLKPDSFFYFNETPFILFFDNPKNLKELYKQIWNFNQTPVVFINYENQIHIYNGFSFIKENDKNELALLANFENDLNDFSFFEIVSGETWEKYQSQLNIKNRVDQKLLDNIKELREILVSTSPELSPKIANNLIGRILFIRYLMDREVKIKKKLWKNSDLCDLLAQGVEATYDLFEYLKSKEKYNGDLFPFTLNERNEVWQTHLNEIINFLSGTNLKTGQLSLFDIYDFSIIPVELVSNVYEYFIGVDNQRDSGAYYTPIFLVNYILNETVSKYFEQNPNTFDCKVLDPSCGSGIFLVETLRKIIWQYKSLNPDCENDKKQYHKKLKELLTENIFGIDIDADAINVAIFSLYITLLDFIEKPANIESFKFPNLLKKNFFEADFFDKNANFNKALDKVKFQYIIGNPPWGKVKNKEDKYLYEEYWRTREKTETEKLILKTNDKKSKVKISVSRKEIAQAFLIRTKDFSSKKTKCGLIVTSKILYNLNAKDFRKYFLENNLIHQVFELSSVRHDVFDKSNDPAVAPASIIFYKSRKENERTINNTIRHISLKPNLFFELFKILVIEKYDDKNIPNNLLLEYDWLWKTLVYGNILDFHLVKRLINDFETIEDLIQDNTRFIIKTGIKYKDGDKKFSSKSLIGNDYVKSDRDLLRFTILKKEKWEKEEVGYLPDEMIFEPPLLLMRKRIGKDLIGISAVEERKKKIFTCSLTGIKALKKKDAQILKNISALFNSKLLAFYLIQTNTSAGIERGDIYLREIIKMPFTFSEKIVSIYDIISLKIKELAQMDFLDYNSQILEQEIENRLKLKLNHYIFEAFKLNNQEQDLINYVEDVIVPSLQNKKSYSQNRHVKLSKSGKDFLIDYSKIYTNHFNRLYKSINRKIDVNIHLSKYTIGIEFCVVNKNATNRKTSKFNFIESDSQSILNTFAVLSYEKISENLFRQKDIKGFNEENFFIVKPNEYKCWHRAVAHLDLTEFLDSMLKAGANQKRSQAYVK